VTVTKGGATQVGGFRDIQGALWDSHFTLGAGIGSIEQPLCFCFKKEVIPFVPPQRNGHCVKTFPRCESSRDSQKHSLQKTQSSKTGFFPHAIGEGVTP